MTDIQYVLPRSGFQYRKCLNCQHVFCTKNVRKVYCSDKCRCRANRLGKGVVKEYVKIGRKRYIIDGWEIVQHRKGEWIADCGIETIVYKSFKDACEGIRNRGK